MCKAFTIIRRNASVVSLAFIASSCGDPPAISPAAPTPNNLAVRGVAVRADPLPGARPPRTAPGTPTPIPRPGPGPTPPPVLSIAGLVTDPSGNPIGDATVTARLRGMPVHVLTNIQGRYGFDVPQPNYLVHVVTAEKDG